MIDITDINESSFILGGAAFSGVGGGYGFGSIKDKVVDNIIRQSLDFGVKAVDLAPIYGFGQAEKTVGRIVRPFRDKVFLTSKSGVSWHSTKRVNMTNDPKTALNMLEKSLSDLQTDYIDAYFIHWPDSQVDIRRTMEVLARKKEQGLIRYIGLCNSNAEDFFKASEIDNISILQSELNIFNNGFDQELISKTKSEVSSFWGWGTFDKGIISGSVTKGRTYEKSDCRSWAPWWKRSNKNEKIEIMEKIFNKMQLSDGVSLALSHAAVSEQKVKPILGIKSLQHLDGVKNALQELEDFLPIYHRIMNEFFHEKK